MTTKGNLELRIGQSSLCTSMRTDGYEVFEAVPKLVNFLDSTEEPTSNKFKDWFYKTSRGLSNHHDGLIGGVSCEVIIDASRKIILHNAGDESNFPDPDRCSFAEFENACILLKEKYQYQIFKYIDPRVREVMKEVENQTITLS